MDATTKSDFYGLCIIVRTIKKSVLMITHDPEEVNQFADRNIHLVRDPELSLEVFFNVHDTEGRVTMLDLFQYDFMQRALLASGCHESFFSCIRDFSDF